MLTSSDFGSAPTLFTAGGRQLLGVVNKSGIYYALDRTNIAAGPASGWQDVVSKGFKSLSSVAFDGKYLYVGNTKTTISGKSCVGSVRVLDPATGVAVWSYCSPGKVVGAVTATPGLVIVGADTYLLVLDAATGHELYRYIDTNPGSQFWGSSSVSNGVIYAANQDDTLIALGL